MSIERERLDAAGAARVRRANTRRFAALLLAQACLLLGSAILCFACPLYVLDETGSATAYGLVGAVSFLPYLAATPLGGVLADRADCGRIFTVLGMGLAAVTACMPLCRNALGSVASTIVLLCAVYAAQAICKPAVQAAIPELLVMIRWSEGALGLLKSQWEQTSWAPLPGRPFTAGLESMAQAPWHLWALPSP